MKTATKIVAVAILLLCVFVCAPVLGVAEVADGEAPTGPIAAVAPARR